MPPVSLSADYLRHVLHYDPLTGEWTWINPRTRSLRSGDKAGTVRRDGRRQINLDGSCYLASRLAWLYMTGEWPKDEIDHKNRIKGDDRWENLRDATHSENMFNREWCERSGDLRGISIDGIGFRVMISNRYVGYFKTIEEAKSARDEALKEWAGPFAINPSERQTA